MMDHQYGVLRHDSALAAGEVRFPCWPRVIVSGGSWPSGAADRTRSRSADVSAHSIVPPVGTGIYFF